MNDNSQNALPMCQHVNCDPRTLSLSQKMAKRWVEFENSSFQDRWELCGQKSGLVGRIREKMKEENITSELTAYHCIIHQESLCGKALKMEHVMSIITLAVNFIRAKGLNHRQFKSFLEELSSEYGDLSYQSINQSIKFYLYSPYSQITIHLIGL